MPLRPPAGFIRPGYNPLLVPNPPAIGTASIASATSVSITFTAPANVGGGAITGYIAMARRVSDGTSVGATGASSPITITGLTTDVAYTVTVAAVNSFGPSAASAASGSVTPVPQGQQEYTTAGTYSWVAPAGVTSVSVVAVGGGKKAVSVGSKTVAGAGGGGGGLGWKNNITVTPGSSYTVIVGKAGGTSGTDAGGDSSFINTSTVRGGGASSGTTGGTFTGDGGGNGGSGGSTTGGGGGAGGYSGDGGNGGGGTNNGTAGAGGGGGGGFGVSGLGTTSCGGGVGINGQGSNGTAGVRNSTQATSGSGGGNPSGTIAGTYGGGGGGVDSAAGANGAVGAVRIIWGAGRAFPSTNTGNL